MLSKFESRKLEVNLSLQCYYSKALVKNLVFTINWRYFAEQLVLVITGAVTIHLDVSEKM